MSDLDVKISTLTAKTLDSAVKTITPRGISKMVVSSSIRFVVTGTIVALVPTETRVQKVKVMVGGYAIASLISDKAKAKIDRQFDEWSESLEEARILVAEAAKNEPEVESQTA